MTRMATRMSFKTSGSIFGAFLRWSPSTRTIEEMVLCFGRKAAPFMEQTASKQVGDDEILLIEADGKAPPTATEQELEKRRGKRRKPCEKGCLCGCQRHRSRRKRAKRGTRPRRKKGDKSKNGKSATIVAVYTLKRGEDGQYHGPYNKRIWESYAPRKVMLEWAMNPSFHNPDLKLITAGLSPSLLEFHPANLTDHRRLGAEGPGRKASGRR